MSAWRRLTPLPLVLLSACNPLFGFSSERAAVLEALEVRSGDYKIERESIQVLQSQQVSEVMFVLLAFIGEDSSGFRSKCLFEYEMRKGRFGWEGAGSGGCGLAINSRERFQGVAGGAAGSSEPFSTAYGLVNAAEITIVEAVWDDGECQQADVINASFLIVRQGTAQAV